MNKYIDAEKLITDIKGLQCEQGFEDGTEERGYQFAIKDVLDIISSLQQEQPEVDLEKELDQWRHKHFNGKRDGDYNGEYLERESQLDLARHFWNKGYNAKK